MYAVFCSSYSGKCLADTKEEKNFEDKTFFGRINEYLRYFSITQHIHKFNSWVIWVICMVPNKYLNNFKYKIIELPVK